MKKLFLLALVASILLSGCAKSVNLNGKQYPPYGFFNQTTDKSTKVCYHLSAGSVIVAIIFVESIIVPIWTVGFDLWEATRIKNDDNDNCDIDG